MKIGVIGAGLRIKRILELLLKINKNHEIVSIYDPSKTAIEKYKTFFNQNFKIEKDYASLLEKKEISWIFIGSPNKFHKKQILLALKHKKNIFCEKPLAINTKDLIKIKKAFKKNGKKFLISYPLRHSLHYKKIKEIIEEGKIGKIISLEFNEVLPFNHGLFIMGDWRRFNSLSGGHLLEKCCHDFDIVNWLVKSKAKKISSFGGLDFFKRKNFRFFKKIKDTRGELIFSEKKLKNAFFMNKNIVDNQVVIIEYENNLRAVFHTNCNSHIPERRLYICGTHGTIRANLLKGKIEFCRYDMQKSKIIKFDKKTKESHGGGDSHLADKINLAMISEYNRPKDLDDAIKSSAMCIFADKARRKNKVLYLKKFWKKLKY